MTMTDAISQASQVPWHEVVIERIERQTAGVKSFFLRPQDWRPFRAGQHLDVRLTAPDGYQAQRSYSVASAPELEGSTNSSSSASRMARSPRSSTMLPKLATRLRSAVRSAVTSRGVGGMADLCCSSAADPGLRRSCQSCVIALPSVAKSLRFFFMPPEHGTMLSSVRN